MVNLLSLLCSILEWRSGYNYDIYKYLYTEQLYRWSLFNERSLLLNKVSDDWRGVAPYSDTVVSDKDPALIALACAECEQTYTQFWCDTCSSHSERTLQRTLQCSVCRCGVRGPAALCLLCGHGGHAQHLHTWFQSELVCPSGCGCQCLSFNGIEY